MQAATQAKEKMRHIPVFARTLFTAQHAHQQATPVRDGEKKWKIDFEGRRRKIKFNCWQNGKKYFASEFMVEVERFIKNIIQYCANNLVWVIWRGFFNSPVYENLHDGAGDGKGGVKIFSLFTQFSSRYLLLCAVIDVVLSLRNPSLPDSEPCQDRNRLNDFRLIINLFPWRFKLQPIKLSVCNSKLLFRFIST